MGACRHKARCGRPAKSVVAIGRINELAAGRRKASASCQSRAVRMAAWQTGSCALPCRAERGAWLARIWRQW